VTAPRATVGSAADDGTSTPEADASASSEAATPRSLRRLLVGLGVLLALLAVTALVLGLRVRDARAEEDRRQDALRYAKQMALNLTSISVQELDTDIEQVLDGATGEFEEDFARRSDNLREVLTTNEVVSEGNVLEAALVRSDEDTATALVVVDATVRNAQNPRGGVNTYRMKLELERQGDRWLTSLLEFVG
jgi:Mce-associated membrane protein